VGRLRADRPVDLSRLSLALAVQVVARVVGLTNSSPTGMARRLDAFFAYDTATGPRTPRTLLALVRNRSALLRFFYLDVKPAIRARRRQPGEDVISQLLDSGFSDLEILTECVTYGAAGMATTREFITVAAWHLLSDPELLARYRQGDTEERTAILSETLRLEPVIGHLFRQTSVPVTLATAEGPQVVPAGSMVDLDIRAANADPAVVGADPLGLCPARDLGAAPPALLSFGDGHHKCPGGPLAILESEIFLTLLLKRDVVLDHPPRVRWNSLTQGYDLDSCLIRLAA
jgi:cytochrome P450